MFVNPGQKIKTYSKVVFWIMEVFAIITSISSLVVSIKANETLIGIILAIVELAFFTFLAWIVAIYMIAYGEMIEDIQKIAEESKNQNEILNIKLEQIANSISNKG